MKVLKLVYNSNKHIDILDIVNQFKDFCIVETYNTEDRKEVKSARGIQTNLGSKNLPIIAFEDENLELIAAIWPENKPDWKKEIETILKTIYDCKCSKQ